MPLLCGFLLDKHMWYYKNYDVICTSILKWFMNLAVLAMNDKLTEQVRVLVP